MKVDYASRFLPPRYSQPMSAGTLKIANPLIVKGLAINFDQSKTGKIRFFCGFRITKANESL